MHSHADAFEATVSVDVKYLTYFASFTFFSLEVKLLAGRTANALPMAGEWSCEGADVWLGLLISFFFDAEVDGGRFLAAHPFAGIEVGHEAATMARRCCSSIHPDLFSVDSRALMDIVVVGTILRTLHALLQG